MVSLAGVAAISGFLLSTVPEVACALQSSSQALNQQNTNIVSNANGPVLYYNGSGDVPPYNVTPQDPPSLPPLTTQQIEDSILADLISIRTGSSISSDNCTRCIAIHELLHLTALTQPASVITNLLVRNCEAGGWTPRLRNAAPTCEEQFAGQGNLGPYWAQMLAKANVSSGDFQVLCAYQYGVCQPPDTILIDESKWFTPKPKDKMIAPTPSGETLNVLHLTDFHIDSRFDVGSEANCSQYMCCRPYSTNTKLFTSAQNASVPASRFGYFYCDPPPDLALSLFQTMPSFIDMPDISFALFTGDAVAHDNDNQLSQEYVEYTEQMTYLTMKGQLGNIPVYATLGNHDSLPQAYESENTLNAAGSLTSWNHALVSSLWEAAGWINASTASYASSHYGAYATTTKEGLKIIALNTEFWYIDNVFNYINYTNPDTSGMLSFLISELEASEATGQRVWIIGHVPTGYDNYSPLPNPTALFYSIVRRFSPATIAGIFFGHTHQDQFMVYYDFLPSSLVNTTSGSLRNTSAVDYTAPLNVAYMGASLTGYNAGWRLYTIDAQTFQVLDHQTYVANLSNANSWATPEWALEYTARGVYNPQGQWPAAAALNATFWNGVVDDMLGNASLANLYSTLESKSSALTKNCTLATCVATKACYIRSASGGLQIQCPGVSSVLFSGALGATR